MPGNAKCAEHAALYERREATRRNEHPRQAIYNTNKWKLTAKADKQRHDYTCQRCGWQSPSGRGLVSHHVYGVLNTEDPYDLDFITTLCKPCSGIVDGGRQSSTDRPKT